jgi:chromatin assembly factor 1 subunit B
MCKEAVLLYNSQQQRPFAYFDNLHLDALTSLAWTPDGRVLVISSLEGYNTYDFQFYFKIFIFE